jgi:2-oxoglutarate ferredoxin oxidoreductase subunit alpha
MRRKTLKKLENKKLFILGDEACAYGAIFAGCNFFAGYPITPATEIFEILSKELPNLGGYCIQMEDEIASISAVIGAAWAGAKSMTATSGPGFSLMQENIGYAIMTETPCVIVDVQRSGPSTGQATKPSQGDLMQSRWGTHGDHNIIVLSPNSVQECFDLTIECFNLAETYRTPVILLIDGEIAHIREVMSTPYLTDVKLMGRKRKSTNNLIHSMIEIGCGRAIHITGSTHRDDGMRDVTTPKVHEKLVTRLYNKIDKNRDKITKVETDIDEKAELGIISWGVSSRPSYGAVLKAREHDIKVSYMRMITIWPFPKPQVKKFVADIKKIVVPELNLGQLSREIERFVDTDVDVISVPKLGGICHTVNEIYSVLSKSAR